MNKAKLFNMVPNILYSTVGKLKTPRSIAVLMYHEVLPDDFEVDAWTIVKESDFRRQLQYIVQEFEVISLDRALQLQQEGQLGDKRYLVLTFDDGYYGAASTIKDVAEEFGVPYTVYVASEAVMDESLFWYDRVIVNCNERGLERLDLREVGLGEYNFPKSTGYQRWQVTQKLLTDLKGLSPARREIVVDQYFPLVKDCPLRFMNTEELAELADNPLVTIGGHSHCHNRLNQLDMSGVIATVEKNKKLLESWTGQSVNHFAYPNGDYNQDIVDVLIDQGYKTAVTTEAGGWLAEQSPLLIPRYSIGRYEPLGRLKAKLSGLLQ